MKKLSTLSTNPPYSPLIYINIYIYKGGIICSNWIKKWKITLGRPRLGLPNTLPLIELKNKNQRTARTRNKKIENARTHKLHYFPLWENRSAHACWRMTLRVLSKGKKT